MTISAKSVAAAVAAYMEAFVSGVGLVELGFEEIGLDRNPTPLLIAQIRAELRPLGWNADEVMTGSQRDSVPGFSIGPTRSKADEIFAKRVEVVIGKVEALLNLRPDEPVLSYTLDKMGFVDHREHYVIGAVMHHFTFQGYSVTEVMIGHQRDGESGLRFVRK